jgi:hypothetical protein
MYNLLHTQRKSQQLISSIGVLKTHFLIQHFNTSSSKPPRHNPNFLTRSDVSLYPNAPFQNNRDKVNLFYDRNSIVSKMNQNDRLFPLPSTTSFLDSHHRTLYDMFNSLGLTTTLISNALLGDAVSTVSRWFSETFQDFILSFHNMTQFILHSQKLLRQHQSNNSKSYPTHGELFQKDPLVLFLQSIEGFILNTIPQQMKSLDSIRCKHIDQINPSTSPSTASYKSNESILHDNLSKLFHIPSKFDIDAMVRAHKEPLSTSLDHIKLNLSGKQPQKTRHILLTSIQSVIISHVLPIVHKLRDNLIKQELIDSSDIPTPLKEAENITIEGDIAQLIEERLRTRIKERETSKRDPYNRARTTRTNCG